MKSSKVGLTPGGIIMSLTQVQKMSLAEVSELSEVPVSALLAISDGCAAEPPHEAALRQLLATAHAVRAQYVEEYLKQHPAEACPSCGTLKPRVCSVCHEKCSTAELCRCCKEKRQ